MAGVDTYRARGGDPGFPSRSEENAREWGNVLTAGVLAGIIGGLGMILAFMLRSALVGYGFFAPLNLIGATWFGLDALGGGMMVGFAGLVTHLLVSAFWGAVFASVAGGNERSAAASFWIGILLAAGIWALMTYFVLPWANPVLRIRAAEIGGWWFTYHMVYGVFLTLGSPILNSISRPRLQVSSSLHRA